MNTKLVSRDEKKIVFTSEISSEAFEASVNRVYNKMKSRFNIPGFRKGKAPRKIIELNYGEGIFFEDAVNELLPELFEEAVKELKIGKNPTAGRAGARRSCPCRGCRRTSCRRAAAPSRRAAARPGP